MAREINNIRLKGAAQGILLWRSMIMIVVYRGAISLRIRLRVIDLTMTTATMLGKERAILDIQT